MTIFKTNGKLLNPFPVSFDDFFRRDLGDWHQSNFSNTATSIPAVNIKETPETFEVAVAAPGMSKQDFTVELNGNLLTISSEKANGENEPADNYIRREFSYQSFQRSFELKKDVVDENRIQAKYEDGVLHLLIPKKEEAKQKQPRLIEIA